ncbi:hypothetical protein ACWCQS_05470 [Streptomyces sp. NPDC002076]
MVPDEQVWAAQPEANRQVVVGQLVRLASRALTVSVTVSEQDAR